MKEREILRQAEHRFGREKEVMLVEQRNQNLLLSNLKTIQVWHYTNDIYSPVHPLKFVTNYTWQVSKNGSVGLRRSCENSQIREAKTKLLIFLGISSNKNRYLQGTMKWNNWKHYTTLNIQTKMWLKSRTSLKYKDILNCLMLLANSFTNLPCLWICKNNDLIYI